MLPLVARRGGNGPFSGPASIDGRFLVQALVAAMFALHPLRVESVAWVAERKDVLSGLFWMLTLLAYGGYVLRPSTGRYLALVVTFALGLMAKSMLVTLPCVLLLLDLWPLRRWQPKWRLAEHAEPLPSRCPPSPVESFAIEKLQLFGPEGPRGWASADHPARVVDRRETALVRIVGDRLLDRGGVSRAWAA